MRKTAHRCVKKTFINAYNAYDLQLPSSDSTSVLKTEASTQMSAPQMSSTFDSLTKGAAGAKDAAAKSISVMCERTEGTRLPVVEASHVRNMRGSEKALFNLRDIASDLDQDGTVTKDEQYVTNQLKAVANMDGDICGKQLYMLLLQFAAVRKGYRLVKCFAVLLIVACIAQALRVPTPALLTQGATRSPPSRERARPG